MKERVVLGALLVALALAALFHEAAAVKDLSPWQQGILTHYGGKQDKMDPEDPSYGSKEGSCGYGPVPKDRWPYFSVAALATSNTFFKNEPSNGCGQCFQIQCVSGMTETWKDACYKDSRGAPKSILVVITDSCPECADNHLDVQALSFAKLTNPDLGRININYRRVECTPPDDMKVSVMDFVGSNGWLRLAIDDTGGRGSVTQVYVKSSSAGDWILMQNKWGAAWELPKAPTPPLDFKMVTDDGEEVVAQGVIQQNGGIRQGAYAPRVEFATGMQFTIRDPKRQRVQAAGGPDEGFDPMLITSEDQGGPAASPPQPPSSQRAPAPAPEPSRVPAVQPAGTSRPPAPSPEPARSLSAPSPVPSPAIVPIPSSPSSTALSPVPSPAAVSSPSTPSPPPLGRMPVVSAPAPVPEPARPAASPAVPSPPVTPSPPVQSPSPKAATPAPTAAAPSPSPKPRPAPAGAAPLSPSPPKAEAAPEVDAATIWARARGTQGPAAGPAESVRAGPTAARTAINALTECEDVQPPPPYDCVKVKTLGICDRFANDDYCARTCGRCGGVRVEAFAAVGSRRLLGRGGDHA